MEKKKKNEEKPGGKEGGFFLIPLIRFVCLTFLVFLCAEVWRVCGGGYAESGQQQLPGFIEPPSPLQYLIVFYFFYARVRYFFLKPDS